MGRQANYRACAEPRSKVVEYRKIAEQSKNWTYDQEPLQLDVNKTSEEI